MSTEMAVIDMILDIFGYKIKDLSLYEMLI